MIYTHKNSQPYDFAPVVKLVLVSIILICFVTVSYGQYSEMHYVDRALHHCELIDGVYQYEDNICVVSYTDFGEVDTLNTDERI